MKFMENFDRYSGMSGYLDLEQVLPEDLYAKIDASNEASIQVALSCGLRRISQKYSEEKQFYIV